MSPETVAQNIRDAQDALRGAARAAERGDLFTAGAYTRNAHVILDRMLDS